MKDFYAILGVPKDADPASIRKAFKTLARKYHPDINKEKGAEDRFKEVSAAYEVLGDDQKRALYDEFGEESLRTGFDPDRARAWKNMGGGRGGENGHGPGGFGGIRFEDLFGGGFGGGGFGGGGFGGGGFGGGGAEAGGVRRGADIEGQVEIGLLDAVRGAKVDVSLTRPVSCGDCHGEGGTGRKPCTACGGKGRRTLRQFGMNAMVQCDECGGEGSVYERECARCGGTGRSRVRQTLGVHIPAGVDTGQVIRLRGKGGEGVHGGPDGDLLLTVRVAEHGRLRRTGNDLEMDLPVTLTEALGGATVEVPTPTGRLRVKVPPRANNGQRLRLGGKGVQARSGPGDLYLIIRPTLPATDDPGAIELAKSLDALGSTEVRAGFEI